MAVLPPTELSTCATRLVGICIGLCTKNRASRKTGYISRNTAARAIKHVSRSIPSSSMEFINKLNSEIDLVCSPHFRLLAPHFESLAQTDKMRAAKF